MVGGGPGPEESSCVGDPSVRGEVIRSPFPACPRAEADEELAAEDERDVPGQGCASDYRDTQESGKGWEEVEQGLAESKSDRPAQQSRTANAARKGTRKG